MTGVARQRVGVVGVGHLGRHHARILAEAPDVELVSVVDIDLARADQVASETGARAGVDALELLGQVDAVTVAVPTAAHAMVASPFLDAGIPVLVEKPIAASLAEADAMIRLASRGGVIFAVGHSERYNPAVTAAMSLVSEPRFVEVHRLAAFSARGLDVDVVFDVMIHDIDILLAIMKTELVSIEAVGVPVLTDRIDIANARLHFRDGCIANLTASRISRDRVRKLRFFQHHALVTVDCLSQQVEAFRVTRSPNLEPLIEGGSVSVPDGEPLELELRDFVNAVRIGGVPRVDGVAGRRALAVAEEIAAAMLERDGQLRRSDHVTGGAWRHASDP
jgi:predicted dehydrogenase